jgi:hypothetical protein
MEFHLLRETPDNSGTFVATGDKVDGTPEEAVAQCAALAAKGGRFAVYVYESIRAPDAPTGA